MVQLLSIAPAIDMSVSRYDKQTISCHAIATWQKLLCCVGIDHLCLAVNAAFDGCSRSTKSNALKQNLDSVQPVVLACIPEWIQPRVFLFLYSYDCVDMSCEKMQPA